MMYHVAAPQRFRTNRAFTLIELLVVIAIIAILAAILFPVFAKARNRALMSGCTSNLKQLFFATQMYREDFNSLAPARWTTSNPGEAWMQFAEPACYATVGPVPPGAGPSDSERQPPLLNPYLKSEEVKRCPADTGTDGFRPFWKTTGAQKANVSGGSYPFNPNVAGRNPDSYDLQGARRNPNGGALKAGDALDLGNRCMFWDGYYFHQFKSRSSRQMVMWNGSVRLIRDEDETRRHLW